MSKVCEKVKWDNSLLPLVVLIGCVNFFHLIYVIRLSLSAVFIFVHLDPGTLTAEKPNFLFPNILKKIALENDFPMEKKPGNFVYRIEI